LQVIAQEGDIKQIFTFTGDRAGAGIIFTGCDH
jgi:hypothetical protein